MTANSIKAKDSKKHSVFDVGEKAIPSDGVDREFIRVVHDEFPQKARLYLFPVPCDRSQCPLNGRAKPDEDFPPMINGRQPRHTVHDALQPDPRPKE